MAYLLCNYILTVLGAGPKHPLPPSLHLPFLPLTTLLFLLLPPFFLHPYLRPLHLFSLPTHLFCPSSQLYFSFPPSLLPSPTSPATLYLTLPPLLTPAPHHARLVGSDKVSVRKFVSLIRSRQGSSPQTKAIDPTRESLPYVASSRSASV